MRLQRLLVLTFCLLTACTNAFPSKPEYELESKEPSYLLNKVPKTPVQLDAHRDDQIEKKPAEAFGDNSNEQNKTESLQDPLSFNTTDDDSDVLTTDQLAQKTKCPPSKDKDFKTPCQLEAKQQEDAKYEYFWSTIPVYVWVLVGIIILCACVIPGVVMCSWCICPCALFCCNGCEVREVAVSEV